MNGEHIKVLREMHDSEFTFSDEKRALKAAIAALGGVEYAFTIEGAIKTMSGGFVHVPSLTTKRIPDGTKLYAFPAPPSKEG